MDLDRAGCAGSLTIVVDSASSSCPVRPPGIGDESESDRELVGALESYIAACDRGEYPGRVSFLRAHPEIAPRLAECLEGLEYLERAAVHFDRMDDPAATGLFLPTARGPAPPERLGDYRILGEIGRGGMGIVYEAEQVSLGRRVALKLLPFTAAMDPRLVQRFQVEVQAAAHLHHRHIVPIYAVGCEEGIHYYVMQHIAGRSLACVLAELRHHDREQVDSRTVPSWSWPGEGTTQVASPGPGSDARECRAYYHGLARLGIQAAEALEHAHALGVVHRDIKPANLLLDGGGHLWVADFGLARLQGDSGLTATGDLLGTIRYMSPEQATAQHGIVDHRTDVYSLGATLYEFLALRPAFPGKDVPALVSQIQHEEPLPPSRIDSRVPRDLETIVLKAMAKEPGRRYPDARSLAVDLQRFLEDQPIHARRPSPGERAVRWARRHRTLVGSAVVVLILSVVCLSISTVMIWNAMESTARESRARAAELNKARAGLELAQQALDLYLGTAETWFPRGPGDERPDFELLRKALAFYEKIANQSDSDPRIMTRIYDAYRRAGDIRSSLGEIVEAESDYRKALRIMDRLVAREPDNEENKYNLATALDRFGTLLRSRSTYVPAEWAFKESLRLFRGVAERNAVIPSYRLALAKAINQLAGIRGETGQIELAMTGSQEALGLLKDLEGAPPDGTTEKLLKGELATTYSNLATWHQILGRFSEAESGYRLAIEYLESPLRGGYPSRDGRRPGSRPGDLIGFLASADRAVEAAIASMQRLKLSAPLLDLAGWHHLGRNVTLVQNACRTTMTSLASIGGRLPSTPAEREALALCRARLGKLLLATLRSDQTEVQLKQAVAGLEHLAADFPVVPRYRRELARVYDLLHGLYAQTDRPDQAAEADRMASRHAPWRSVGLQVHNNNLAWYLVTTPELGARNPRRAIELAEKVVRNAPEMWAGWNTLGVALYRNADWDAARKALERSLCLAPRRSPHDAFFLAMTYWRLDRHDLARQWIRKAEEWRLQERPGDLELLSFRVEAEALIHGLGDLKDRSKQALPTSVAEMLGDPSFGLGLSPYAYGPPPSPNHEPESLKGLLPESSARLPLSRLEEDPEDRLCIGS